MQSIYYFFVSYISVASLAHGSSERWDDSQVYGLYKAGVGIDSIL